MKDFPLTLCALALVVSTSIGASSCTEDSDTDPCEAYCEKAEECYEGDHGDCMPACKGQQEQETEAYQQMLDCDTDDNCEDWIDCLEDY